MDEEAPVKRTGITGRDLDEAAALFEDDYGGADFRVGPSETEFDFRYTIAGDERMTLRSSTFLASISGTIQPSNEYIVSWIHRGSGITDVGRDETHLALGRPAMFPTGKAFAFDFADYRQSLIQFSAPYLEEVAAEHEGALRGPIQFDHAAVPGDSALLRWKGTVDEAARLILEGEPTALQLTDMTRRTAVALLDTFAHTTTAVPEALLPVRNARLRRAVEFMHAHAHLPLTPTTVAAEAGLSPRGLQQAFQRQLGTTPLAYLRSIRLDRVNVELRLLTPTETTVGAVAARWGFTHAGRFAGDYARRFGESPSATLRR